MNASITRIDERFKIVQAHMRNILTIAASKLPSLSKRSLLLILSAMILVGSLWIVPFPREKLIPKPSTAVVDRQGAMLRVFISSDQMWHIPVTGTNITPQLRQAVICYEDKYFNWHLGINPIALVRAAKANLKAGRIVQGGSTLTMQVARMMEPKPRNIRNKLIEMFRALQLEARYSKEQILNFYFNLAPYGGNIVGVVAAAQLYFNKRPDQLSLGECALLAAIPNSPTQLRPDVDRTATQKARDKVLRLMHRAGKISSQQLEEALAEPIPERRADLPFLAPHLCTYLVQNYPSSSRLETTIDVKAQQLAEAILEAHLQPWRRQGITNGSVVIIENKTQQVLAFVGSADFFDAANQGQVNGAMATRSPGSALKPFIYALGIEHGLISPQSRLYDIPVEYGGYQPENYDNTFHGMVSVTEALTRSLNVPAVNLSAALGEDGIYTFLKNAGVTTLKRERQHYGLSLILGGCEVTLLELTNLYAGLANGGIFRPYRLLKNQPEMPGKQLLSEGTCYIISELISQLRRPDLPASWEFSMNLPKVAWKTGTSYGHRDAWSIGYTPQYTIGVWIGNFDGKGAPALVGAEVAAPILFALFTALEQKSESRWFIQPASVAQRQVCAVSGRPLTENCAVASSELYLPGISPNLPCDIHQSILIDKKTGTRLCSHCRIGRQYEQRIVEQWPAEIATWMERNGFPIEKLPEHFPGCSKLASGDRPIIRSPSDNAEFKIRPSVSLKYQKILLDASVSNSSQKIFWFLDGRLVFHGPPAQKIFITPKIGNHHLICVDDEGRSSEVTFVVK